MSRWVVPMLLVLILAALAAIGGEMRYRNCIDRTQAATPAADDPRPRGSGNPIDDSIDQNLQRALAERENALRERRRRLEDCSRFPL